MVSSQENTNRSEGYVGATPYPLHLNIIFYTLPKQWAFTESDTMHAFIGGILALRATFRLCSPQRAPRHTHWKRP